MGWLDTRDKGPPEYSQKWSYITLSDFRATSAWTSVAYIWLWLMFLTMFAIYAVDTFTAINLLAFDRWSSQIQPAVPFKYTKWIFAGCIILSFVLAIYEWMRATRVISRGGIAESYMDPLAVSLQSIRPGGWRRFLVFTELTKSKKGADYVCLFTYFNFKTALRVILAEGPRQAINGMSLYAVMNADLVPQHATENSSFVQFWVNLGAMADSNKMQAAVFFGMLYSLIIWVFSAIALASAALAYLFFVWHYIPSRDGKLQVYCRRKIDRRLGKILERKITTAVEEQHRKQLDAETKAELALQKKGVEPPALPPKVTRAPTLPQLGESPELKQDSKFEPTLRRRETGSSQATLPPYSSRPPTRNASQSLPRQPTLPNLDTDVPRMPTRSTSAWTATSYESDAPLLANAGAYGESGRGSPAPTLPTPVYDGQSPFGRPPPVRSMTAGPPGMGPQGPLPRPGHITPGPRPYSPTSSQGPPRPFGPPMRSQTALGLDNQQRTASPMSAGGPYSRPMGPPPRSNTADPFRQPPPRTNTADPFRPPASRSNTADSFRPLPPRSNTADPFQQASSLESAPIAPAASSFSRPLDRNAPPTNFNRPFNSAVPKEEKPLPSPTESYEMKTAPSHSATNYVAFNPSRGVGESSQMNLQPGPQRNVTISGGPTTTDDYFGPVDAEQRSFTAPISDRNTMIDIIADYGPSARSSAISYSAYTPSPPPERSTPGETHLKPPQAQH